MMHFRMNCTRTPEHLLDAVLEVSVTYAALARTGRRTYGHSALRLRSGLLGSFTKWSRKRCPFSALDIRAVRVLGSNEIYVFLSDICCGCDLINYRLAGYMRWRRKISANGSRPRSDVQTGIVCAVLVVNALHAGANLSFQGLAGCCGARRARCLHGHHGRRSPADGGELTVRESLSTEIRIGSKRIVHMIWHM